MKIRMGRTLRRFLGWTGGNAEEGVSVRAPNTAGIRAKLTREQQHALFSLSETAGYQVLLDVIEMVCVENDARLINLDVIHPEEVLAAHRMSKAFWQIFMEIQKKIEYERREYLGLKKAADDAADADEDDIDQQDQEILRS